jgi:hypothetical protein
MKPGLIVIDKDTGRNVHSVAQHKSFFDTAFFQALLNLRRNVNVSSSA